jgi:2-iminoacetate synthase
MNTMMPHKSNEKVFIDRDKLYELIENKAPSPSQINDILEKALKLQGLDLNDVAALLKINDSESLTKLLKTAGIVKEKIYGKRLVLFAPVYTGNICENNCLYCAFRNANKNINRKILNMEELKKEVSFLLKEGHKRLLLICGESKENDTDYMCEAIKTTYSVKEGKDYVRRINVELAPMEVKDFEKIKKTGIGTYVCFQETYDPVLYKKFHPGKTPKTDYEYRLTVMDRAMQGGINDVGIGALFGLADYRFEVLAMMEHASHLEKIFGCGPHTVSVPRIEEADSAPLAKHIPNPVSDENFKKLIAIIRIALPYTGIILSTRENEKMREELFYSGISQISAGSRTNPGAYADDEGTGSQFSLGDHRSLDEVIASVIEKKYIPSFCTGCYRKGRVGNDFMDLAKPGLIKQFCLPNAIFTFKEYLLDFAKMQTKNSGNKLIEEIVLNLDDKTIRNNVQKSLNEIETGKRDIYF